MWDWQYSTKYFMEYCQSHRPLLWIWTMLWTLCHFYRTMWFKLVTERDSFYLVLWDRFILIQVIEIQGHFAMRKQRQHTLVRRLVREATLRYCSMYTIASITSSKPSNTSEMAEFAFPWPIYAPQSLTPGPNGNEATMVSFTSSLLITNNAMFQKKYY